MLKTFLSRGQDGQRDYLLDYLYATDDYKDKIRQILRRKRGGTRYDPPGEPRPLVSTDSVKM
jgi:hypothetical protein